MEETVKLVKPGQLDTSRPGTWPIYYKILLWVLIFALMFFLYNRFVREDLLATQQRNQNDISELEKDYETLYQYSIDLPLYEEKKQELTEKLLSLLEFLPAQTEMPNLIDEVYQAAYKSDIIFNSFTPQSSIVSNYYNVEPISLSTTTNFKNFAQFVQYVGELPRILNVQKFEMAIDAQKNETLGITSTLETYIYNQDISRFVEDGAAK